MTIRVLVSDDHEVVRSGIGTLLEGSEVEIVGTAANTAQTIELARTATPDVVLLDVRLGEEDGLLALRKFAGNPPKLR